MAEIVDLTARRYQKAFKMPVPWKWGESRTVQGVSRQALTLAALAVAAMYTRHVHFTVLPYAFAIMCFVLIGDFVWLAIRAERKVTDLDKPPGKRVSPRNAA